MLNLKMQRVLAAAAAKAANNAYAPYSQFAVGAALLPAGKGRIITGCNIENASFGLALCAERVALAAAIAAGFRKFKALAVVARGKTAPIPCGACLQVLAEFCAPDFPIITGNKDSTGGLRVYQLRDLLPRAFRFRT